MPFDKLWEPVSLDSLKYNSPSRRAGTDWEKEKKARGQVSHFIALIAAQLNSPAYGLRLQNAAVAAAQILAQRFYSRAALEDCERWVLAAAALYVVSKSDTEPGARMITSDDVAKAAWYVKNNKKNLSADEVARVQAKIDWVRDQETIVAWSQGPERRPLTFTGHLVEMILRAERVLVHTVGWQLHAEWPQHKAMVIMQHYLYSQAELDESVPPETRQNPESMVARLQWSDAPEETRKRERARRAIGHVLLPISLRSVLCVAFTPDELAAAAVHLACEHYGCSMPLPAGTTLVQIAGVEQARFDEAVTAFGEFFNWLVVDESVEKWFADLAKAKLKRTQALAAAARPSAAAPAGGAAGGAAVNGVQQAPAAAAPVSRKRTAEQAGMPAGQAAAAAVLDGSKRTARQAELPTGAPVALKQPGAQQAVPVAGDVAAHSPKRQRLVDVAPAAVGHHQVHGPGSAAAEGAGQGTASTEGPHTPSPSASPPPQHDTSPLGLAARHVEPAMPGNGATGGRLVV